MDTLNCPHLILKNCLLLQEMASASTPALPLGSHLPNFQLILDAFLQGSPSDSFRKRWVCPEDLILLKRSHPLFRIEPHWWMTFSSRSAVNLKSNGFPTTEYPGGSLGEMWILEGQTSLTFINLPWRYIWIVKKSFKGTSHWSLIRKAASL